MQRPASRLWLPLLISLVGVFRLLTSVRVVEILALREVDRGWALGAVVP